MVSMTRIGVNLVDILNSMPSLFKPQCSLNAAAELQKVVVTQRSSGDSLVEHEYSEDEQISTGYVRHKQLELLKNGREQVLRRRKGQRHEWAASPDS